jgi:hypothetical protein
MTLIPTNRLDKGKDERGQTDKGLAQMIGERMECSGMDQRGIPTI